MEQIKNKRKKEMYPFIDMYEESLEYFYEQPDKSLSYIDIYNHLLRLGCALMKDETKRIIFYDENVIFIYHKITKVLMDVSDFESNPHTMYGTYGIKDKTEVENPMDATILFKYEEKLEAEKQKQLLIEQYEEKNKKLLAEEREHKGFKLNKYNYWLAIGGIALGAVFGGIQTYDIFCGKDFNHEAKVEIQNKRMIEQDSIQIIQNTKIIELLEQNKQKDTVYVKAVAPPAEKKKL